MKLLFDANLSPDLVNRLADVYPGSDHVKSIGLRSSDTVIWKTAAREGFVIASKDSDFEQRSLVFGAPPKVIWMRLGNCRTGVVESLLRQRYEEISAFDADDEACILVIP